MSETPTQESPLELAARLLAGAGSATVTFPGDDSHPVLHGRTLLGHPWVLGHPDHLHLLEDLAPHAPTNRITADDSPPCRCADAPKVDLVITETAPLPSTRLVLTTLHATGRLVPVSRDHMDHHATGALLVECNNWPDGVLAYVATDTIAVHTPAGQTPVDPYAVCLTEPDPLAELGVAVPETLAREFGEHITELVQRMSEHHDAATSDLDLAAITDVHVVSADSHGISLLCYGEAQTPYNVRLPFTRRATTLQQARGELHQFMVCAHSALGTCPFFRTS